MVRFNAIPIFVRSGTKRKKKDENNPLTLGTVSDKTYPTVKQLTKTGQNHMMTEAEGVGILTEIMKTKTFDLHMTNETRLQNCAIHATIIGHLSALALIAERDYERELEAVYGNDACNARYDTKRNGATPELKHYRDVFGKACDAMTEAWEVSRQF